MEKKRLKEISYNSNEGDPDVRRGYVEEAKVALRQDLLRLRDKAESQCREFAALLAAWTSRRTDEAMRPVAIEQDLRETRLLSVIAWLLTATELAVTFFLSLVFAISAPFLFLLALVAIFALKAGLLSIWRNPRQPQQTRRRLRRYVIAPSLAVTLMSLAVLFLARSAGLLALLLLPLINLAIFSLSMGVLGLAAGLFALAYLMSWSRHAERRFNALEREAVETRRVLQQVERVAEELSATETLTGTASFVPSTASSAVSAALGATASASSLQSFSSSGARAGAALLEQRRARGGVGKGAGGFVSWLVLMAALSGGGCKLPEVGQGVAASATPAVSVPPTSADVAAVDSVMVEIWLDWSLSAEDQPYGEAVRSLIAALPGIAAEHNVSRVAAYRFGDRGWSATEVFTIELPLPQSAAMDEGTAIYGNVRRAQDEEARRERLEELRKRLAVATPERLLPAGVPEPPCTDVRGVLTRVAETPRPQRRLVF
ncbi:MAG TPA: hypothetical protein PLD20_31485, partial [Blastocatellia bacterium]|nr:hypothetical protein [Blastocatellia bacterium]